MSATQTIPAEELDRWEDEGGAPYIDRPRRLTSRESDLLACWASEDEAGRFDLWNLHGETVAQGRSLDDALAHAREMDGRMVR